MLNISVPVDFGPLDKLRVTTYESQLMKR